MRDKERKLVRLLKKDRFFYNQEFYLREPTPMMIEMGLGYTGRYNLKFFNRNRFIGVMGREAFHVFDLSTMKFIQADPSSGYRVNIDSDKVIPGDADEDDAEEDLDSLINM